VWGEGGEGCGDGVAGGRERAVVVLESAGGGPDLGLPQPLCVPLQLAGAAAARQDPAAAHAAGARGGLLPAAHAGGGPQPRGRRGGGRHLLPAAHRAAQASRPPHRQHEVRHLHGAVLQDHGRIHQGGPPRRAPPPELLQAQAGREGQQGAKISPAMATCPLQHRRSGGQLISVSSLVSLYHVLTPCPCPTPANLPLSMLFLMCTHHVLNLVVQGSA
jgi:hypothetical protein